MGNTSGKHDKNKDIPESFHDLSGHGNLTEREASSAWYRYGVAVTDVYDVVEVLGQGHMGEVFTVRRKTTGHHTKEIRDKLRGKESHDDLKMMAKNEDDQDQFQLATAAGRGAGVGTPEKTKKGKSRKEGSTGKSKASRPSFRGAAHKVNKEVKKLGGRGTAKPMALHEDADSNLSPFIDAGENFESQHEPPASSSTNATPLKSIIRDGPEAKFSLSSSSQRLSGMDIQLTSSVCSDPGDSGNNFGSNHSPVPLIRRNTSGSSMILAGVPGSVIEQVRKGVHFQRTFAVKTILTTRIHQDQLQELVNEIMIMRKLDHPYVLKLYEVYHVKRKLWLVTELLSGGDLSSRKLNEHDSKNVIEQVLRALVYLHRMGIVHRDIKLENVLYENHSKQATVRLIDFGLSRTFDRTSVAADYSRTPYTMSPEAAAAGKNACEFTDKTDVWAVGVIAFIMLSGEFPFIKTNLDLGSPDKIEKLKRADCHFGVTWKGRGISPLAKDFVKGCLQADPDKRWTAKQALEHLQKEWAPEVDKIWDAWQERIKKSKKPEFVQPQDLPGLDDDDDDISEGGSQSGSSWLDENCEEDLQPAAFDNQARAKFIKKHVQKVVNAKKAEAPIYDRNESVKIDMAEVERYTKFGFMKKTILMTMANTMDRGDVPKLRELFLKADTEDTGTITLKELINAFQRISPGVDEKRVEDLFFGIDRDKSGHIHYAEFLAALAESHGLVTLDRLTEAFDRIDTDGKGYITHDDLKSILGNDYDKELVDEMIEEGDFKKNNKIDYEELLQLMFSDPVKGDALAGSVAVSPVVSPGVSFSGD